MRYSYFSSVVIVIIGLFFGFFADSINTLTLWITSALYGGYAAANVLKWIWWRFNGYGYFFGMLGGLIASTIIPIMYPDVAAIYLFPIILGISFAGCIIGTYASPQSSEATLIQFYRQTYPWGFWRPVIKKIQKTQPDYIGNSFFKLDCTNVIVGIIWQMTLVIMPIYLIIKNTQYFLIALLVFIITSIFLKKNWYDKLETLSKTRNE